MPSLPIWPVCSQKICSTIITIQWQFCCYLHNKGCSVICTLGELKRNKTHRHAFSSVLQSADFIHVREEKNGGVVCGFSGEEMWTRNQATASRTQTSISTENMLTQSCPRTQSVVQTESIKTQFGLEHVANSVKSSQACCCILRLCCEKVIY